MIQITHDTRSEFQAGAFDQTVLEGSEQSPEIRIGQQQGFSWSFEDSNFTSGWTPAKTGSAALAQVISGQIYLRAQRGTNEFESYALFSRSISLPDRFVVEYRIRFTYLEPAGVSVPGDPLTAQPKGACARLDIFKSGRGGLRFDIFSDKMVSFWTRNPSTKDYPTTAFFNVKTEMGRWYTLRLEGDFTDPSLTVHVYRDNVRIGELKRSPNNVGAMLRPMAYARNLGGSAEVYVDSIKVGTRVGQFPSMGTYTSPILNLGASAFGPFGWTEKAVDASIYPWKDWTKYSGNPILDDPNSVHNFIENILTDINDPLQTPILYPHPTLGDKYWLVYANMFEIRLAYSADLIHWTPYEKNPILSPAPGEGHTSTPQLFKDGATYYLIHDLGLSSPHGMAARITYSTAPSPLGPWKRGPVIVDIGSPGEWDDGRVTEPFVFKDGNMYYLFYMGDGHSPYCQREQIGLASTPAASFPRGPWTKHGLILPLNPDPAAWDRGLVADPSVIKVNGTYYMLYTGSHTDAFWKLGIASAPSPFGPWRRPSSPNLTLGPNTWDSGSLLRGAIHYHQGKFYMPYSGTDNKKFRGGMAIADPLIAENRITMETRSSPDGIQWEAWKPVLNGSIVQSTPNRYFQYRATLRLSSSGDSPVLTSVTIRYQTGPTEVLIPLAVLSTPAFDATTMDPSKISYGGTSAIQWSLEDVNGDGSTDLLLFFRP